MLPKHKHNNPEQKKLLQMEMSKKKKKLSVLFKKGNAAKFKWKSCWNIESLHVSWAFRGF